MKMTDLILKKRNGLALSEGEINWFITNFTSGNVPDYQASALLMAIFFNKLNMTETTDLTMAMVNSGDKLNLSEVHGIKVDKHSTGGVSDTTTLVLAPMVAAAGVPVIKMAGRGLGHTGGTIDKLESISGFNTELTNDELIDYVNKIGIAISAQTADLAPADKKLYELRDVTGTVENISLIASSIMSKKIAAGADCIVLDVKCGDGAFMKDYDDARDLAETMVQIGEDIGKKTVAIISNMSQPLGNCIGNVLEVKEAIAILKGQYDKSDLLKLCVEIGSYMLLLGEKAKDIKEAKELLLSTIKSGSAFKKFMELVSLQGGNIAQLKDTALFKASKYVQEFKSSASGYITKIHTEKLGQIAMELGAGRDELKDKIDISVGIILNRRYNDFVNKDDVIAYIHYNEIDLLQSALYKISSCFELSEEKGEEIPLIYEIITH